MSEHYPEGMGKQIDSLSEQLGAMRVERNDAMTALRNLMPFVLEDYYPDCATPEFKSAVERAKELVK